MDNNNERNEENTRISTDSTNSYPVPYSNTISHIINKFSNISILISIFILFNVFFMCIDNKSNNIDTSLNNIFDPINYDFFSNNYTNNSNNKGHLRSLPTFWPVSDPDSDEFKKNVTYFFKNVSNYIYEGSWSSKLPIDNFDSKQGDINLHLTAGINIYANETQIMSSFKFLDEEYIDNWYYLKVIKSFPTFMDPSLGLFDFESNSLIFDDFDIYLIYGKLFDKVSETYECKATLKLTWGCKLNNGITFIDSLIGTLETNTDCAVGFGIKFNSGILDPKKEELSHVFYSILMTFICLTQIFSTIWLNHKTIDSFANSNSISLFTMGQNVIWNAYGCLCHFFLSVNNEQYISYFGVPAFLYFTNFSIFELRLLYNTWKNQNITELNDINIIRKKLIKFYITFYIFLFLSLFFVTKFYFEEIYIMLAIIVTWLPQIIHNAVYKNQTSMPIINIILNSLNKIVIPIYFRGFTGNIFKIKTDVNFVYLCIFILLIEILVMYIQTLCGPRFFIPCKLASAEHKFYHTKDEILNINKEFEFSECSICLFPLFSMDSLRKLDQLQSNDFYQMNENVNINKCQSCLQKLHNKLFDFHEYHYFNKKAFILTPCNHVFHTDCLENWLKLKRECPTDRTYIPPINS